MNNSMEAITIILDYDEKKEIATVVDKFIKREMVYKLNTEAKFTAYSDVYQEPYPKIPVAAIPYDAKVTQRLGNKLEQKLLFADLLKKQEKVNEWPSIAKQITGKIAGMISAKAHEKIRTVFHDEWADAIKAGTVHKVIDMIRNGLVSKAARIREFDRMNLEREIMNFGRMNKETTAECNDRLSEMISRATSMECQIMEKKKLILLYLYANKRHFGEKNLITIESYIDSKIKTYENKSGKIKSNLKDVMKGLLEIEETNKQYQDRAEPVKEGAKSTNKREIEEEDTVAMVTSKNEENQARAKSINESQDRYVNKKNRNYTSGSKFRNMSTLIENNKSGTDRWYNDKNINTMVVATKLVAENKYQKLEDAVRSIVCASCDGRYHVQADCRRQQERSINKSNVRASNYNNKARDVYMIHQALATLDKHNYEHDINHKNVFMVSDINDTQVSGMMQYNKWRYNIDNHCNVVIFNNSLASVTLQPNHAPKVSNWPNQHNRGR